MYVGVDMIRASQLRKQEKRLHTETLEELSESFDDNIKPMVVEIQGTQHRLTGTADAQYDEWRDLLRRTFVTESGFVPEEVAIYTEPALEAPLELPPVPELVPVAAPTLDTAPESGGVAEPAPGSSDDAAPTLEAPPAETTTEAADADTSASDGV
jgi:hypothetical protein